MVDPVLVLVAGVAVMALALAVVMARRVYQVFLALAILLTGTIALMVFGLEMTPERPELLACVACWLLTWGARRLPYAL